MAVAFVLGAALLGLLSVGFVYLQFGETDPGRVLVTNRTASVVQLYVPENEGQSRVFEPIAQGRTLSVPPCSDRGYQARDAAGRLLEELSHEQSCELSEWVIDGQSEA